MGAPTPPTHKGSPCNGIGAPDHQDDLATRRGAHVERQTSLSGSSTFTITSLSKARPSAKDYNDHLAAVYTEPDGASELYSPFSPHYKIAIVIVTGVAGMLVPLATNVYLPTISDVARDLDSSVAMLNLALSVFVIGQGVAPLLWGPLADQFGRRPAYALGCLISMLASVGCALAQSDKLLLGMRFLQAFGGSATIVVSAGSVSDLYEPDQRGIGLGFSYSAQMLGPILGTIIGGYLSDGFGWRWTFWFIAIVSGVFMLILTLAIPETHRPTVARRYNLSLKGLAPDIHRQPRPKVTLAQVNPFGIVTALRYKYVWVPTMCTMVLYGSFFSVNTVLSTVLDSQYHYTTADIGLSYIPAGAGSVTGPLVGGFISDRLFRRQRQRRLEAARPTADNGKGTTRSSHSTAVIDIAGVPYEARLLFPVFSMCAFPLALVAWGWTMQFTAPIAIPFACHFLLAFTMNAAFNGFSTYLVDLFTAHSASIMSLSNLFRCLYTALWLGLIETVTKHWSVGWAFVFQASTVLVGTALAALLHRCGEAWREDNPPVA
ncbi:hypothetical protein IWQ60_005817 [Tieghemiomyces parasiticus]|uniref:Major facilitator superfamily (MFS) profile domain-containing protein n=1 Tax=Tieghemiomyces parasiticus TaxID=78921 RepID=A0A9W8A681_9FUNG|nr:hypothetical protein IWQ60_005817 [Tieghemiomyces parasiticus]